jgi:eukaryotic-like serine/threonine-protein kinase
MSESALPGIFISYRRSDSPDATGRIYDRLVSEFGKAQVFKDVDSIPLGQDFRGHLNDIVGNCAAMLAIVGPQWSEVRDKTGQRRLDDADDFVRIELEAALTRDIPVVPVLVGHAPIPVAKDLPDSLASMAFRQSIEVRPDPDFHNDVTRLVAALRGILDPNAASKQAAAISAPAAATGQGSSRRLSWIVASAAILGMTLLAVPAIRYLRETPPPEIRTNIDTPSTAEPNSFALSPDGRQIVFAASGDGALRLWLRSLASTTMQPLAGTEGATYPFWSPDSRSIGFFAEGALKRLDLAGGVPQTLAPAPIGTGGTWNAAGVILYAPSLGGGALMRVSATGGAPLAASMLTAGQTGHYAPIFLPNGHQYLFAVLASQDRAGIYLGDLSGGAPTRLTSAISQAVYLPTGWMLWNRDGALVAQRLDIDKAALTGVPVTLADGLMVGGPIAYTASVSATGLVAYRIRGSTPLQLTWFDHAGAVQSSLEQTDDGSLSSPRVAPDGRRVLVQRGTGISKGISLLDGARVGRLTSGAHVALFPVWSPDGSRIVFASDRFGRLDLFQKVVNGAVGDETPLVISVQGKVPNSWSPDGRYLLYESLDPQTSGDLWIVPMVGDHTPVAFLKTPFDESLGTFSPDGRWVAYQSDQSGATQVFVRPFTPPGTKDSHATSAAVLWQVSTAGGAYPTWRPDGKEIYYLDPSGEMMAAPIIANGATLAAGTPVKLFQTRIVGGSVNALHAREYDISPDGRFLINTILDSAAAPITLIQNWNPEAQTK